MLFNSLEFIFLFLPVSFVVYFILNKYKLVLFSRIWLVACSLFFYSWWDIKYLPLLLLSIFFNFGLGIIISKHRERFNPFFVLLVGISINVLLLGYYKYYDFFIVNINDIFSSDLNLINVILPLGISFFTFTQIAFLVDAYKKEVKEFDIVNYMLFVTYFPHLIAGPILHHKEMMPQFASLKNKFINYKNVSRGLFIFSIGLFKKVIIADTFAGWASYGFDKTSSLNFYESWATSLSYTFQLYYDFSGYTDMAIGIALLFNIKLPNNFNSPYKALNIQDFWRRWHMTLSRFLRDYIYIPMGGNRKGLYRTYTNLLITFIIGGIWHGAGWTFLFWGFLHGIALVLHRIWSGLHIKMNKVIAWFITFNFINITWVFFRAKDWDHAIKVLNGMFGLTGLSMSISDNAFANLPYAFLLILLFLFVVTITKNSIELMDEFKPSIRSAIVISIIFVVSVLLSQKVSEFLYFNF
ncbi:MBOAT family O-acyltransferase [Paenibacillus alginolyticus]|uniref:MBOAT family O-acyltransferase n=1 Tax=Paenibacillus alginolyticus TaxID=59839 RepID=UPI002DB6ACAD|nr:MBOAT family protein [Paenibacillus alginolyticus]MEC0143778.1 MBOAT family protein [Paenibacillus alginolyticus]